MSTIQPYKIEQKVKDGQKARWPYMSDYSEPQREGYAFIGWKFNNNVFRPPFNDETTNPFGPINQDTEIYSVWDKVVGLNVISSQTTITSGSNLIEIEYWGDTLNNLIFANDINVEFIDVTQEGKHSIQYQDNGDTFVSNKIKKSLRILANNTTEQRYLKVRVTFDNLKSSIVEIIQDAKQESEECEPIVENTTGATTLALKMFGVDTEGSVFVGYTSNTYDIYYNCGSTLVGLLDKNNTGGLVKENSRISTIDEYAIMTKLPQYYGSIALTSPFTTTYTITTANNSSKIVTLNYKGFIDENNLILLRGSIANKAIRVPCNGFNGKISIAQYPYDYSSDSLSNDPKMVYMSLIDGNFSIHGISQNTISYDGFDGELTNLPNSSIDYNFIYEIQPNDMCDYRLFVVYFTNIQTIEDGAINPLSTIYGTKQTDKSCVMLQFIQEYDVRNRIYYEPFNPNNTKSNYPSNFDDKYNETQSVNYKYHSWFETCSSKTLTENSFTLNLANGAYHIAYPVNDFDYTLSNLGTTVIDNYIWGDKSYTIIEVTNIQNITFTKNS